MRAFPLAVLLVGCVPARSAEMAALGLDSMSVDKRHDAADDLAEIAAKKGIDPVLRPTLVAALFHRLSVEGDDDTRTHLVEALGAIGGDDVVSGLLMHLAFEADPVVRHKVFAALAETGDPLVEQPLTQYLQTRDYREQRERALLYRTYMERTGRLGLDPRFGYGWPYGTHGFPEHANSGAVWIDGALDPPRFTVKGEIGVTTRVLFDVAMVAAELDTSLGARTRFGIWGARFGMFQGATASGLGVEQFHVGPYLELPTEWVRPSLQIRFSYFHLRRNTHGDPIDEVGFGARFGLAFDLWRHELDHAVFLSLAGSVDGLPEEYALSGGTLSLGARY